MRLLQAFNGFLLRIGSWGTVLFMAIIAIVVPYEVIGRYLFQKMNIWTGEVATYSLVWASLMGGAVGLRKGYQVSMTTFVESVPRPVASVLGVVSHLFTLFFFATMFWYGLFQTIYNLRQTSPAIGLIMSAPYAALPVGFFIMFFFTLEEFLKFLASLSKGGVR